MTSCPTCNKPVDSLRARNVGVRDGKVVAYCSPQCAAAAETRPTKVVAPTPVVGAPTVAVPEPAKDSDSGPLIEIIRNPLVRADGEPAPKVASAPAATPAVAEAAAKGAGGESATVAPVVEPPERAVPAKEPSRPEEAGSDWTDEESAEHVRAAQKAEAGAGRRRLLVLALVFLLVGSGAFAAYYFVLRNGETAEPPVTPGSAAGSSAANVPDAATPVDVGAPVPTKESAVGDAIARLRELLAKSPPRVQRLAAGALGRTGDPAAVAALAEALTQEKVAAMRFRVAYQLARAGDSRGVDALVSGLTLRDRGDKLDAANQLAQLGDERAKPLLESMLSLAQHRLRAAEELSRLKDPAADTVLEQIRVDPEAGIDSKATATLALLRAGRTELAGEVRALLDNSSWRAFAAYALAEIKDEAARPVLVDQVRRGVGVRVLAAHALRRLDPGFTDVALLVPLVEGLASPKDQEQIIAAEAILVLAGDLRWAKYP